MAENTTTSSVSAPLSVIIIGCGRVAEKHLKAISKLKGLDLKAVVDTNPDSAKRLLGSVKGFAGVKQYSDYKTAIDEVKPSIVSVTVPSGLHFQIAKYAMEHGSNLLLEKPMILSFYRIQLKQIQKNIIQNTSKELKKCTKKEVLEVSDGNIIGVLMKPKKIF